MKLNKLMLCAASCVLVCTLSSCVDDDYDLGDIDGTVNIGGKNLAIPLGKSEAYLLKKLVEDEATGGSLITKDHNYYFQTAFNAHETDIDANLDMQIPNSEWKGESSLKIPGETPTGKPLDLAGIDGFTIPGNGDFKLESNDERIKEIGYAQCTPKEMPFSIDIPSSKYQEMVMKDVTVTLPSFLVLDKSKLSKGTQVQNDGRTQQIITKELRIKKGGAIKLYIKGFNFCDKWDKADNRPAKGAKGLKGNNGNFSQKISYTISCKKLDLKQFVYGGNAKISSKASFNGKLNIEEAYAKVHISNEQISEYLFDDFPQKMDKKKCLIDPINLNIFFEIKNKNKDLNFVVSGSFSSEDGKVTIPFENLKFKTGDNFLVVSKKAYEGKCDQNIVNSELTKLIRPIPEKILANLVVEVLPDTFTLIKKGLRINKIKTTFELPFAFETNTQFEISDNIHTSNIGEEDMVVKKAQMVIDMYSTVPMDLKLIGDEFKFFDEQGKDLSNALKVSFEKGLISGSKDGSTPVMSQLIINLEDKTGKSIHKIDHTGFKAVLKPSATGIFMQDNQYFKIKKAYLRVPNGVTIEDKEDDK